MNFFEDHDVKSIFIAFTPSIKTQININLKKFNITKML